MTETADPANHADRFTERQKGKLPDLLGLQWSEVRKGLGLDRTAAEAPAEPAPAGPRELAAAKAAVPKK